MAKSNRTPRAKNKIEGSYPGSLIKIDADPLPDAPAVVDRSHAIVIQRSTLFTAEFEEIIEIIATERVYRAMLAGFGRRLLISPMLNGKDPTGRS
jgi:hypothetical protein